MEQAVSDRFGRGRVFGQDGPPPFSLQIVQGILSTFGREKTEGGDATLRSGEQALTKGSGMNTILDFQPRPTLFEFTGGHGLKGDKEIVETAGAGETGRQTGVEHSAGLFEPLLGIFDGMVEALKSGDKVELRGFGSFRQRVRRPRQGRNPMTGEVVNVPARQVPYFKPGKGLKELINS